MAFACISMDWTVSERYGPSEFEVVRMGRPTYYLDDKAEWALRHGGHIDKGIRDDNGKLMALPDLIPAEDDSYDDEVEAISQRGSGDSSLFGLIALAGIFAVGGAVAHFFSKKTESNQTQQALEQERRVREELCESERGRMRRKMKRKLAEKTAQVEREKRNLETERRIAAEEREQRAWQQVSEQRNLTEKILAQHEAQMQHDRKLQEQMIHVLEREQELLLRQQKQISQQLQILQSMMQAEVADQSTINAAQVQIKALVMSMQDVNSRIRENADKTQAAQCRLLVLEQEGGRIPSQGSIPQQVVANGDRMHQAQLIFARTQAVERGN